MEEEEGEDGEEEAGADKVEPVVPNCLHATCSMQSTASLLVIRTHHATQQPTYNSEITTQSTYKTQHSTHMFNKELNIPLRAPCSSGESTAKSTWKTEGAVPCAVTLSIKIAQTPYMIGSLRPKALKYESFEGIGYSRTSQSKQTSNPNPRPRILEVQAISTP